MNKYALIVFKGAYDSLCIFIYSIGLYIFSSDAWPCQQIMTHSTTRNWVTNCKLAEYNIKEINQIYFFTNIYVYHMQCMLFICK